MSRSDRAASGECRLARARKRKRSWDAWIAGGLPADLVAHAESCERCGPLAAEVTAELAMLRGGLDALAREADAAAADVRVADSVIAALASREPSPDTARRARASRWWWLAIPAVAAAALALVVVSARGPGSPAVALRLDAPGGVLATRGAEQTALRGDGLTVAIPVVLSTGPANAANAANATIAANTANATSATNAANASDGARTGAASKPPPVAANPATLHVPAGDAALWPETTVRVDARRAITLNHGGVDVRAAESLAITAGTAAGALRVVGRQFAIETTHTRNRPMKILRTHRAIAAAAAVAVAVYVGWATLSVGSSETRVRGPVGVAVTDSGELLRFPLLPPALQGEAIAAREDDADDPDDADARPRAGAFWDEDSQLVVFAVPGEVFDADTGAPVSAFRITAEAIESRGYGQARPESWSFADRADGAFRLHGLGVGRWRVTVRAHGYAPLAQTLNLGDVGADPYLVAPLARGARLGGRVIDWRGQPVADAEVGLAECVDAGASERGSCSVTRSAADGTFAIEGVPERQVFALSARHPRHGQATVPNLQRTADLGEHVAIQLPGVLRVTGEVTRGERREPVAGAAVFGPGEARTTTDGNGVYELFMPLEHRPEVLVESSPGGPRFTGRVSDGAQGASGESRQLVWVNAATHVAEARVDFRLAVENASLHGRITDASGAPLAGVELDIRNITGWNDDNPDTMPGYARTDADGRYRVDDIPAECGYKLRYRAPGDDGEWQPLGYVNIPDQSPVEANFQLGAASIRGRFVDADTGAPFAVSGMSCTRLGAIRLGDAGGYYVMPECYADGRFELTGLPPGRYRLHNRVEWMASALTFHETTVEVAAGAVIEDVQVRVEGEQAVPWKVRVLGREGRILSGAHVRYEQQYIRETTRPGPDGTPQTVRSTSRTMFTRNLEIGPDGVAIVSLSRAYETIYFDCPGYQSVEISLRGRDPAQVVEVRLSRTDGGPSGSGENK